MPEIKHRSASPVPEVWPGDSDPGWNEIDEASWESFPASDPPAYSSYRVIANPTQPAIELGHHTSRRARIAVAGLSMLAFGALWLLRRRARS